MADPRFFLGNGERLTSRIPPPGGGGGSDPAYSFHDAIVRLSPMVGAAAMALDDLPDVACPQDEAVGVVTLHPQWIAKSYHPQQLLDAYALRQVGSRPTVIEPERWTKVADPEPAATSDLYVAGHRDAFRRWASEMEMAPTRVNAQIQRIEAVRAPTPEERLRNLDLDGGRQEAILEVVLHASEAPRDQFILRGFAEYASRLGVEPHFERRLHAGGLCFLPVKAELAVVGELAQFAFLRVARPMPRLRPVPEIPRSRSAPGLRPAPLPDEIPTIESVSTHVRHPLQRSRSRRRRDGSRPHQVCARRHGHGPQSAGPVQPGRQSLRGSAGGAEASRGDPSPRVTRPFFHHRFRRTRLVNRGQPAKWALAFFRAVSESVPRSAYGASSARVTEPSSPTS
jgi:hypothetical protein